MTMDELQGRMERLGLRSVTLTFGRSALHKGQFFANAVMDGTSVEQVRGDTIAGAVTDLIKQMERKAAPARSPRRMDDLA